MLFGVCIYARKWRVLEDEQRKVQMLSMKIQPQKENEKFSINMHAWNELKKQNPDFWAWIYWQEGIVSQPVVIDTGGKEYLYKNFDGEPSVCGTPIDIERNPRIKLSTAIMLDMELKMQYLLDSQT